MIIPIGIFLLVLGILFDDISTHAIILKGYGVMESNPIYLAFGYPLFILISILAYFFIILSYVYIIKTYRRLYHSKSKYRKHYDIFVFLACVFVIFFTITKIEAGFNNMQIGAKIFRGNGEVTDAAIDMEQLKQTDQQQFNDKMQEYYYQNITYDVSYIKLLMCVIFGYLLFRVGFKVSPYDES